MQFDYRREVRTVSEEIQHKIHEEIHIKPLGYNGRIVEIVINERGVQYVVRYFHNGEPKTCTFFPDEITTKKENR